MWSLDIRYNNSNKTYKMKTITLDELKSLQLDILSSLHDFCIKNDIKYSMCYGTLIGAIRHNGFIPWDDDIDVVMTRPNYEKFIHSYRDKTGKYKLHELSIDSEYSLPYAKIEDTRTVLEENGSLRPMGINIDVFPCDNMGDTPEESMRILNKTGKLRFQIFGKLVKPGPKNSFFKKICIIGVKTLLLFKNMRHLSEKLNKMAKTIGKKDAKYAGCLVWGGIKAVIPSKVYQDYILMPFEDKQFYAMKGYDTYLTLIYGDYMQLPPEEKRTSPHTLNNIYWK